MTNPYNPDMIQPCPLLWRRRLLCASMAGVTCLAGCAVVAVADVAVTAVSTVVSTGVKATGAVIDAVIPDSSPKK